MKKWFVFVAFVALFAVKSARADVPPEPALRFRFGETCDDSGGAIVVVQSIDDESPDKRFNGRVARFESDLGNSWLPVMGEDGPHPWNYVISAVARGLNVPGAIDIAHLVGQSGNAFLRAELTIWGSAPCVNSGWARTDNPGVFPDDPFEFFYAIEDDSSIAAEGNFPDGGFDMAYVHVAIRDCYTWTIVRESGGRYDYVATYTSAVLNGQDGASVRWAVPTVQQIEYDAWLGEIRATHPTCQIGNSGSRIAIPVVMR